MAVHATRDTIVTIVTILAIGPLLPAPAIQFSSMRGIIVVVIMPVFCFV